MNYRTENQNYYKLKLNFNPLCSGRPEAKLWLHIAQGNNVSFYLFQLDSDLFSVLQTMVSLK